MKLFGYGSILEVDLSSGEVVKRDIDPGFAREYIGGMGFSCKILFDEVGPEVDPLGPDNVLIFANGPLTGTAAPCSGRTEVTTKSPLTDSIGTGNTGGDWGVFLKRAGIDVLVIRNSATKPVYLWIDDATVELRDAAHLWGKDTHVATDMLVRDLSPSKVSVLSIGPAGEQMVLYSCPINDYHHCAARSGAGAVMGAKKLKAIVVHGSGRPDVARPDEFRRAAKNAREVLLESASSKAAPSDSSLYRSVIDEYQEMGCFPHKNFQTGVLPPWVKDVGRDSAMKYYTRKEGTCFNCPVSCFNLVEVNEGKFSGTKVSRGTHPGVVGEWGAKCGLNNLPAIWRCKELCEQLGMDYVSAAGTIAFAIELFEKGIITIEETGGLELTWGNEDAIVGMLYAIASRQGFGAVLAEGSQKAAALIGGGAEAYVMAIKGMEMMSCDPRAGARAWVLGQAVNPRGGDNIKNTHMQAEYPSPNWTIEGLDMFEEEKKTMFRPPLHDLQSRWEGKALMCKWFEDLYSILNALGLCIFPSGFNLAIGPTLLSKLFSACTGVDVTPREIMEMGEKVFTLLKAYTIRQGLARQDDRWPERFYREPLPEGGAKGAILTEEHVGRILDEYYALRGWDPVSGLPTEERFIELGLQSIGRQLSKLGRLPSTGNKSR